MGQQHLSISSGIELVASGAQSLPWSVHAVGIVALVAGMLLTFAGRRLLRFGFMVAGGFLGAAAGFLLAAGLELALDPLWPAAVFGIAGLALGWLAFRTTVAISLATILACVGWVGGWVVSPATTEVRSSTPLTVEQMLIPGVPVIETDDMGPPMPSELLEHADPELREATGRLSAFASHLISELRAHWNEQPRPRRLRAFWGGILGLILGGTLGFAMPRQAGAVTTSAVGAGVAVLAAIWFSLTSDSQPAAWFLGSPAAWLGLWAVLGFCGLAVQWTSKKRKADDS